MSEEHLVEGHTASQLVETADEYSQETPITVDLQWVAGAIEAILIQGSDPIDEATMAEAIGVPTEYVEQALAILVEKYQPDSCGFELRKLAGGWRYWSKASYSEVLERWVVSGQQAKLSQAALETLSVIAYLQPIGRQRVSAIRGVNVDSVVKTLMARGLVEEAELDEQTHAQLFVTTDLFLEKMGLATLDDLPPLAPLLPEATQLDAELAAKIATDNDMTQADNADTQLQEPQSTVEPESDNLSKPGDKDQETPDRNSDG